MLATATATGFYKGNRIRPDQQFEVEAGEHAKWFDVGEPKKRADKEREHAENEKRLAMGGQVDKNATLHMPTVIKATDDRPPVDAGIRKRGNDNLV